MSDPAVAECGCRPYLYGHRFYHRRDCPTKRPGSSLAPAAAARWRERRRDELIGRALRSETEYERGTAVATLLRDDLAYVDAHLDDADDRGAF